MHGGEAYPYGKDWVNNLLDELPETKDVETVFFYNCCPWFLDVWKKLEVKIVKFGNASVNDLIILSSWVHAAVGGWMASGANPLLMKSMQLSQEASIWESNTLQIGLFKGKLLFYFTNVYSKITLYIYIYKLPTFVRWTFPPAHFLTDETKHTPTTRTTKPKKTAPLAPNPSFHLSGCPRKWRSMIRINGS